MLGLVIALVRVDVAVVVVLVVVVVVALDCHRALCSGVLKFA